MASIAPQQFIEKPLQIALQWPKAENRSQSKCFQNGSIIIVKISAVLDGPRMSKTFANNRCFFLGFHCLFSS